MVKKVLFFAGGLGFKGITPIVKPYLSEKQFANRQKVFRLYILNCIFSQPLKQFLHFMISKFKNAQLVFIDGIKPARIKRSILQEGRFVYEMRETGEIIPEDRLSLVRE